MFFIQIGELILPYVYEVCLKSKVTFLNFAGNILSIGVFFFGLGTPGLLKLCTDFGEECTNIT